METNTIQFRFSYNQSTINEEFIAYSEGVQYVLTHSTNDLSTLRIINKMENKQTSYMQIPLGEQNFVTATEEYQVGNTLYTNTTIEVNQERTETILGFPCYQVLVHTSFGQIRGSFELFTTDELSSLHLKQLTQEQIPNIPGFVLRVASKEFYSCEATDVTQNIDWSLFTVDEEQYSDIEDSNLIKNMTGLSADEFMKTIAAFVQGNYSKQSISNFKDMLSYWDKQHKNGKM